MPEASAEMVAPVSPPSTFQEHVEVTREHISACHRTLDKVAPRGDEQDNAIAADLAWQMRDNNEQLTVLTNRLTELFGSI